MKRKVIQTLSIATVIGLGGMTLPLDQVSAKGENESASKSKQQQITELQKSTNKAQLRVLGDIGNGYEAISHKMVKRDKYAKWGIEPLNLTKQLVDGWYAALPKKFNDGKISFDKLIWLLWNYQNIMKAAKNEDAAYDFLKDEIGLKIQGGNMETVKTDLQKATKKNLYTTISNPYINRTSDIQKFNTSSFQKKYTQTINTKLTNGLKSTFGYKVTTSATLPGVGGVSTELSFGLEYNMSHEQGTITSEERTYTAPSQTVTVNPKRQVKVTEVLDLYSQGGTQKMKGNFTVTFDKNKTGIAVNLNDINSGLIWLEVDQNHMNSVYGLTEILGPDTGQIDGKTIETEGLGGTFNIDGTVIGHTVLLQEFDLDGNPVSGSKVLSKKFVKQ
ncbi:ETX/MTX2 family pore-forming toxin [Listeria sp. PSOL-1]|uniref:ETX/MTX2 family pore-forming toxin n=1 Tax=Listeria sp. PSOL-1 TaxID=1844999 RepID=UPI0013D59C10|nr:ETX/MTX2 family pore-forming toxin [Listeria sp. PSOL-1]